jgi:hypothetical protein
MTLVVNITETEIIKELLYNLYGYNSRLFHKLDDEQTRFERKILNDLSKISYRLLHINPTRSHRRSQIDSNNDHQLIDSVLPKVFVSTIESNHLHLIYHSFSSSGSSVRAAPSALQPVITTSPLLSSILKYFYRLSTNLLIIRIWCRSSSLSSESETTTNTTFENQALGDGGYDLSTVKNSINKVLLAIEQELSLIELRIIGKSSYFETQLSSSFLTKQAITTTAAAATVGSTSKLTLLKFYQQCMKYERLLQSLLGMILNFHDNYDLYSASSPSSSSSSSSTAGGGESDKTSSMEEERNKKQHQLSLRKLQQSFNQISFLYQSEIILKKGEKLEHYNTYQSSSTSLSSRSSSVTSGMIFYRKHENSLSSACFSSSSALSYLSSLNYFYLFIKQLSISYTEYLTRHIMQSLWNKGGKANILSLNTPLLTRNDNSSVNTLLRMMNYQGIQGKFGLFFLGVFLLFYSVLVLHMHSCSLSSFLVGFCLVCFTFHVVLVSSLLSLLLFSMIRYFYLFTIITSFIMLLSFVSTN